MLEIWPVSTVMLMTPTSLSQSPHFFKYVHLKLGRLLNYSFNIKLHCYSLYFIFVRLSTSFYSDLLACDEGAKRQILTRWSSSSFLPGSDPGHLDPSGRFKVNVSVTEILGAETMSHAAQFQKGGAASLQPFSPLLSSSPQLSTNLPC